MTKQTGIIIALAELLCEPACLCTVAARALEALWTPSTTLPLPSLAVPCEMCAQYLMVLSPCSKVLDAALEQLWAGIPEASSDYWATFAAASKRWALSRFFCRKVTTFKRICADCMKELRVAVWH